MDEIATSKFLSFVLRHKPDAIGISLDREGWVEVSELLSMMKLHGKSLKEEELFYIIETNDKQRFALSKDRKKIRANQGHSISNIELGYTAVTPPSILYHGTAKRFLESIKSKGLLRQNRHHVHLTANKDTAKLVGSRHGKPAILEIDSMLMHSDKIQFFITANGVWLTEHVPTEYITIKED